MIFKRCLSVQFRVDINTPSLSIKLIPALRTEKYYFYLPLKTVRQKTPPRVVRSLVVCARRRKKEKDLSNN